MNRQLLYLNHIKITNFSEFSGNYVLEEFSNIIGELYGAGFVGGYTTILKNSRCSNLFIGRFSIVEENVIIGEKELKKSSLSNHFFAYGDLGGFKDSEYFNKIRTRRYFYEKKKYVFIGNDVFIGKNSIIKEGVSIGNGAIILPNSFVDKDIPDYAVVGGSPAKLIDYRFDNIIINEILQCKWWKKDLSSIFNCQSIDYTRISDVLDKIKKTKCKDLFLKRINVNTINTSILDVSYIESFVTGPSHIELWKNYINENKLTQPSSFLLYPIPAVSLFSNQLEKLIFWGRDFFKNIVLFVPDFRIGNIGAFDEKIRDARFINPNYMSDEISIQCYSLGRDKLDIFSSLGNVKFIFWCLFGRESFNKKEGKYIENGEYKHPIWNYEDMINIYNKHVFDVRNDFYDITDLVVDQSIHPTLGCYKKLDEFITNKLKCNIY